MLKCIKCGNIFDKKEAIDIYVKAMLKYVKKAGCPECGNRVFFNEAYFK